MIWRKQPYKVPIIVGKEQFLEIDRFQLLRVRHKDEWNLLIKNTQPFDSGTYECQVSLKGFLIRRNVTLKVTGKLITLSMLGKTFKDDILKYMYSYFIPDTRFFYILCKLSP